MAAIEDRAARRKRRNQHWKAIEDYLMMARDLAQNMKKLPVGQIERSLQGLHHQVSCALAEARFLKEMEKGDAGEP